MQAPVQDRNDLRVFDTKANSFGLDLLELGFAKDPAAGVIGYKVKISAGDTAQIINAAGLGAPDARRGFHRRYRGLCKLHCPGRQGASDSMLGKMVTFVGAEVIEAIDNPNYSRSFLFT